MSKSLTISQPDCVKCLRKKLSAIGAVVFFKENGGWWVGDFEAETPREDAEFKFQHLLQIGVPQRIESFPRGILMNDSATLNTHLPGVNNLFAGQAIIAARVKYGDCDGVRLAWRDSSEPFTIEELGIIECFSACPNDCC